MDTSGQASPYRIGVLASGGGTNLQAVLDNCQSAEIPARAALVISNNSGAGALNRARQAGVPTVHLSGRTHPNPDALDRAMVEAFQSHGVDLVLLAGYLKKVGSRLLKAYANRVLNIHPALLPSFGGEGMYGLRVHKAVLDSGAKVSGVTVHVVDGVYDHGPIVAQETIPVDQDDTPETLAARVLKAEHRIYSSVVKLFAEGRVCVEGGRVRIREGA